MALAPATAPSEASAPHLTLVRGGSPGASPEPERVAAVIDLGSNSWRLVVYAYVAGVSWRRVGEMSEPVRIAKGAGASGRLQPEAIDRGLEAIGMFARYCRGRGLTAADIDVVATSAIRDAGNRDDLLEPARERSGFAMEVLTSAEEARLGFLAAVNTTTLRDGSVVDIGGGSLQLTGVRGRRAQQSGSWPLGAVRVTESLLPGGGPATRRELKRVRAAVRRQLENEAWIGDAGPRMVAVGGAARNLAAAAQRARGEAPADVQGAFIEPAELAALVRELAVRPARARAMPGIKAARADIVLAAALVLESVVELAGADGLEVTRAGLREGVFFSRRLLTEPDHLLDDVRGSALRNLALQCGADLRHGEHVAKLALELHDSLVAQGVIRASARERDLLHASALLHDVGMTLGYDGHAAHSQYVIASAGLAGYSPHEVAAIGLVVRHHRKGMPDPAELGADVAERERASLARCALLLQLAEQLERGQDQAVTGARLEPDGGELALRLDGDGALARWGLKRRVDPEAFALVFGRPLSVPPSSPTSTRS